MPTMNSGGLTCGDLLESITESAIVAIAADNLAVEAVPPHEDRPRGVLLPLHEHCLFKLGIDLGELWPIGTASRTAIVSF